MLKTAGWGVIGVVAGIVVTLLVQSADDPVADDSPVALQQPLSADSAAHVAGIAEIEARLTALEARIEVLAITVAAIPGPRAELEAAAEDRVRAQAIEQSASNLRNQNAVTTFTFPGANASERTVSRLVAGGFTPAEAERIRKRTDELTLEGMQARYEAQRNGQSPPPDNFSEMALRRELGDTEYERYLTALGRSTRVNVASVIAESPAARAGIQAGDRLLSYAGARLFDLRELNPMIYAHSSGTSVVVEVERAGQRIPLVVPSGPLGVMTSSEGNSAFVFSSDGRIMTGSGAQ
jgi:membrane-associated protease RseP (regulator of RpoE activity)